MSARALIRTRGKLATVKRSTPHADSVGAPTPQFADHLIGIYAFIQPRPGFEGAIYGAERGKSSATAYIEPGKDVRAGDRILQAGRTWEIVSPPETVRVNDQTDHIKCELEFTH